MKLFASGLVAAALAVLLTGCPGTGGGSPEDGGGYGAPATSQSPGS